MLEKNFITKLHTATKRNYLDRMINEKAECMNEAKKYDMNYWDGDRKYGYGGYNYIIDRWKPVAENLIKDYKLNNNSKILDVGCGKGFLLYEIKKILPKIEISGFDVSSYAIKNSKPEISEYLYIGKADEVYNYEDNYFDLVISLGTLHNLKLKNLKKSLSEINRVGKSKYIMVESYRSDIELFNLQCWALTCQTFLSKEEWVWILQEFNYSGDYEFIYFS